MDTYRSNVRRADRFVDWCFIAFLGALAMLAGHCAAYQVLGPPEVEPMAAHGDHAHATLDAVHAHHAHMLPMGSAFFLATVAAGLACVVIARRRAQLPAMSAARLGAAQLVALVALEIVQRAAHGTGAVDRRLLLAIALQLPIALVTVRLARRAVAAVGALLAGTTPLTRAHVAISSPVPACPPAPGAFLWLVSSPHRGPPPRALVAI
jgi:hypothetical protein